MIVSTSTCSSTLYLTIDGYVLGLSLDQRRSPHDTQERYVCAFAHSTVGLRMAPLALRLRERCRRMRCRRLRCACAPGAAAVRCMASTVTEGPTQRGEPRYARAHSAWRLPYRVAITLPTKRK